MKNMRWCIALAIVLAGGVSAHADTVVAQLTGVPLSRSFSYSLDGGSTWRSDLAGRMVWNRTGGTHVGNPMGSFFSFCVELTQHVNYNTNYTFNVVPLSQAPDPGGMGVGSGMGLTKAEQIRELWGRHYNSIVDADTSAAFQIAVWEIVYDSGNDLLNGSFRARKINNALPAWVTLAQTWLNTLDGNGPKPFLGGLTSTGLQDQVYFESPAVPLPAAGLGGLALIATLGIRRIRRALRIA